ncbi:MAG: bifunctional [glutamate--ammonia ligase]-adenylyl-L-tyrosine phosphorylase/[glutamate--ammonia-ligase] adenylyltransferase [Gammaproteobacteria bacterium]
MTSSTLSTELEHLPTGLRAEVQRHWRAFSARDALRKRAGEILRVWAASPFAAKTCVQNPQLLLELLESGHLDQAYTPEVLSARVAQAVDTADSEAALMRALRVLRRREWLRIAWRDLTGAAELDETLTELSALAGHLTEHALENCYLRACEADGVPRNAQGEAQRLVVLGMGKLGGRELNFSSDIDLIFAYPDDGQTDGRRALENRVFFTRLGQRLIKVLSEYTADGFVFRVDMRLRPFGDGPLAVSFDAMEDYYQTHGREWERYAMIKARVVAGDRAAGDGLLRRLRPFVYRRYLDYGAFGSLRDMKARIDEEVKRRALHTNIKLGAGGIREIEFIAQTFQLVRGGRDPELQQRELRAVLPALARNGQLSPAETESLLAAYAFLRRVENRLQMVGDQQTHDLPADDTERARLAFAMNFDDWESLARALDAHRRRVHGLFERTFAAPEARDPEAGDTRGHRALVELFQSGTGDEQAIASLRQAGFDDPSAVLPTIKALYTGRAYQAQSATGRERLNRLMPSLLAEVAKQPEAGRTLSRILPLIEAIARRSVYLALLVEHPVALSQLVKLSAASPWIAEYLRHHPILLDELLTPSELYAPPDRAGLAAQLDEEFARIDPFDTETQMERLRQFKQVNILRVAAADVMDALPLMRISDQLTWIAEVILNHVLEITWRHMVARYGQPRCVIDGERYAPGFAIIAYGKLGGIELGYGSDLDLVFLHDSAGEQQRTDGKKPIDNTTFFVRLGQRIVHALTAFTPAGQLYEVDMRLRPSGAAGILVSGLQAFEHYQRDKAWTWEHQALVRARPVAGGAKISAGFRRIRARTLAGARDIPQLRREVKEMRSRMWRELGGGDARRFDLKRDPGGIADIEFMVQYNVLAHAHQHRGLTEFTDNIRILDALAASGLLSGGDARFLQDAYRDCRDRVHALSLQGESAAVVDADEFSQQRAGVQRLWRELMEVP